MRIVVVGGTGPIGSRLVAMLGSYGHEAVAALPASEVSALAGEDLADLLKGAAVVVDVSHSPFLDDETATQLITTRTRNLLVHEVDAGVTHHVALSSVGAERLAESAYFRARCAEEQVIEESPIPYSIVRATPLFESLGTLGEMAAHGTAVRVPPVLVQPVAADDVARLVAAIAMGAPLNDTVEVGGPEPFYLDGLLQRVLGARNDPRPVVGDIHARYYGARLDDRALMAGDEAELGEIRFDDWLQLPEGHAPGTSAVVAPGRALEANEFRVGEVPPGSVLLMGDVAVFSVAGGYCATQAVCPHRAGPLSEGVIDDTTVTCPLHGASFNIWTGAVLRGPAKEPLVTYQVTVVGDIGRVEVDPCSGEGLRLRPPSECRSIPNVDHVSLARMSRSEVPAPTDTPTKGNTHMAMPTETDVAQNMTGPLVRQHEPEIQASGYGALLTSIPIIDTALNEHAAALRDDFSGYRNHVYRLVNLCVAMVLIEAFRRADWIDVTRGLRRFGMSRPFVARLFATWPSAGFHWRLVTLTLDRFRSHPLTPLPMVRL